MSARALIARGAMMCRAAARPAVSRTVFAAAPRLAATPVMRMPARFFGSSAFLEEAEVTERMVSVVSNFEKVDPSKVTPSAHFTNDLGLDSLDTVEVLIAVEEEFALEIPDAEAERIHSMEDAIKYIVANPQAK